MYVFIWETTYINISKITKRKLPACWSKEFDKFSLQKKRYSWKKKKSQNIISNYWKQAYNKLRSICSWKSTELRSSRSLWHCFLDQFALLFLPPSIKPMWQAMKTSSYSDRGGWVDSECRAEKLCPKVKRKILKLSTRVWGCSLNWGQKQAHWQIGRACHRDLGGETTINGLDKLPMYS